MIGKQQFDDMKQAFRKLLSVVRFQQGAFGPSRQVEIAATHSPHFAAHTEGETNIATGLLESTEEERAPMLTPWSATTAIYEGAHSVLPSRKPRTSGPEHMLLQTFLERFHFAVPEGYRLTLFREPRIESGFPDLVCVLWNTHAAMNWHPKRALLRKPDLQLMHMLASTESDHPIGRSLLEQKRFAGSLRRLAEAEVIYRANDEWVSHSLASLFVVKEIIAIEAKMRDWSEVVRQAQINTWFASRSYILVPRAPARSFLPTYASDAGVGLISATDPERPLVEAEKHGLPRSYASWIFNEWVCKDPRL